MSKKNVVILPPYNEKKIFPITGKDEWVVLKITLPTKTKGSGEVWKRYFKTKKNAIIFYKKKLKKVI